MGVSHLISIVGAGPGNPELLTLKAFYCLKNADVVLHDALTSSEILDLANPYAERIYVGKLYNDGQDQGERQNEIYDYFLKFSAQDKKVVRLKSGDPMIFGRGAEEVRFCKENGLNYEIVPGVTAGIAASGSFEIPLTERGKSSMVLFSAGNALSDLASNIDAMTSILQSGSPVVIYMGLNNMDKLAAALIAKSIEKSTAVQILSKISLPNQKIYSTRLGDVSTFLQQVNPESPTTIIIGKYAGKI